MAKVAYNLGTPKYIFTIILCILLFILYGYFYGSHKLFLKKIIRLFRGQQENMEDGGDDGKGKIKKAFVINLDRNKDRYTTFMSKLKNTDFANFSNIERYSAIDGKEIDVEPHLTAGAIKELREVERAGYRTRHYQLTRGAVGCFLSHLNLAKRLVDDTTTDFYLIFEDDVDFYPNAKYLIERAIEKAPHDWDMISIGYIRLVEQEQHANGAFVKPHAFWGMQCYLLNKKGARILIDEVEKNKIDGQIDSYLSVMAQQGKINIYAYKQKLVSSNSGTTDIQMQIRHFPDINPFLYKGYLV